jgi:hypothetical protein
LVEFPPPAPGDIVWCRFPNRTEIRPAKKPRPALVISVMDDIEPLRVRIAYGTSQRTDEIYPTEVLIEPRNAAAYALSGLSAPTKFCFTNVVVLPYNDTWFALAPGIPPKPTPRLGTLHPELTPMVLKAAKAAKLIQG